MLRGTKRLTGLLNRASHGLVGGHPSGIAVEARTFSFMNTKCSDQHENTPIEGREKISWICRHKNAMSSVATHQEAGPALEEGESKSGQAVMQQDEHQVIDGKVLEGFHGRMETMRSRRRKNPLDSGESYQTWLEKYEETLEPLREFFRLHDIDSEWAIAEIYKNGYWGKKVMRTLPPKRHGIQSSTSEDGTAETGYPWEVAIDVWSDAFLAENLPHAPLDIVRRWPSLLCKTPDCLPGTVAVLRAAIPDEESLNETISMFPRILVQSPVKLQHRLLALQMACGMDLSNILPRNPHLFYRHLDSVMSNIRHLRDYSWSLEHFCNLISYRPNLLTMHPDVVKRNTESSLEAVQMVLPDGADAKLVIKAKPQLILIPPSHINERWEKIVSLTGEIAEWKQELQSALDDIVDGSQQLALEANTETGEVSMQNLPNHPGDSDFGAGKDNVMSASQEENVAEQDGDANEQSWEPGEWGSTTIGSAVWTHPKRHQRLEFLIEVVGKNAGDVSFVDALTVHYHRFNHRYPQFDDWVQRQFNSEFRNG